MKLIADSGSTKTHWHLLTDEPGIVNDCKTSGINPFFQHCSDIVKTLKSEFTIPKEKVTSIHFFGAGVANPEKKAVLAEALEVYFGVDAIEADSDLLAAARSLCGTQQGIAVIMGTGSNSCYYDGKSIAHHVSPLGYILGDEGSGAVLGRQLVSDVLKNQLPQQLIKLFFETFSTSHVEIIENVYRKPFPNRFLASFTPFLSANLNHQAIHNLVLKEFERFFERNLLQYQKIYELPVSFTGSIAYHFRDILFKVAQNKDIAIGDITLNPMPGLIKYYTSTNQLV